MKFQNSLHRETNNFFDCFNEFHEKQKEQKH